MSKKRKAEKYVEPLNVKKEARLLPGYIILVLWVLFEVALLSWIVAASFSTTKEIFSNQMLQSGLHFENYIYSWTKGNMGKYFLNSLIYAGFGVSGALLLSAPCAYALSRFKFFYNKVLTNLLVLFLSIPQIMVVLPLYSIAVKYDLLNKHLTLLVLYPLGLDPVLYSALIILAATPTGGTASMFAQQFERDAVAGAQVVTLTTLFSILTLPAFALLAKLAGGA